MSTLSSHISESSIGKQLRIILPWVGRGALWIALIALVAFNGFSRLLPIRQPVSYNAVLQTPFRSDAHTRLAQILWKRGFLEGAKRELSVATDLLSNPSAVLGATSPETILKEWEQAPHIAQDQLNHWAGVTREKPDYRDGFIMAAVYAYELGEVEKAKNFLEKALTLEPTATAAQTLLKTITR